MKQDAWKRPLPSAVDDCAIVTCGYEQQLELQLNKTIDATPQQVDDWYENELKVWADRQFPIIWIACAVQLSALGFMGLVMMVNQYLFT